MRGDDVAAALSGAVPNATKNRGERVTTYVPLIVAAVAGIVAVLGYLANSRISRLRERERYFVDALLAVERYKQLPYWRHRLDASPELAKRIGEVHENLAYHRRLLQLDSPQVYLAYTALVNTIRSRNKNSSAEAPVERDRTRIELDKKYSSRSKPDRDECLRLMTIQLKLIRLRKGRYKRPPTSTTPTSEQDLRELSE